MILSFLSLLNSLFVTASRAQETNLTGVNAALMCIKLFKYIRITQRLTRLSRTISRSAKDTLTYGGILFIFISGFAVSAPPVVTLLRSRHAIAGDGVSCVWL